MDIEELKDKLEQITGCETKKCGFEAYLLTKELKRLRLAIDGDLEKNLKESIINVLKESYLSKGAKYLDVEKEVDERADYYVMQQTEDYKPFDIANWEKGKFSEEDLEKFKGFLFSLRANQQEIWCYQNRRNNSYTNRKKTNILARLKGYDDNKWIFKEQTEKIISFSHAVDIVIVDDYLITGDIGLLERSFDFQVFIKKKGQEAVKRIYEKDLFSGEEALKNYLEDKKCPKSYQKKMMKTIDSPILSMYDKKATELYTKLSSLERWKGKFKEPVEGTIPIETNDDIEAMIDLLIERFTKSEVSGLEYDTIVKRKVETTETINK